MISLQTLGDITKLSQLCDITLIIKWYHLVQLVISLSSKVISHIKWSGILANFAYSWLAETWFTRPYLRVSTPQMLNDGLFGVSVMSQRKRRFSRQSFAQTGEFDVHFLMTSQYTHLISRRFLLAADNAMDVSLWLKSISCKIPNNLIKQL